MAIRILIRRNVPEEKARELLPLFKKMRQMAGQQNGFISEETLRDYNNHEEFLIISSWVSVENWEAWMESSERQAAQDEIDSLLGGQTRFDIFHYGFAE